MNTQAEQMWIKFIDHLNEVENLNKKTKKKKDQEEPELKHVNFIGSIERYKKIFLEANNV